MSDVEALNWTKQILKGYSFIDVEDDYLFKGGTALCAIAHYFRPDMIDEVLFSLTV